MNFSLSKSEDIEQIKHATNLASHYLPSGIDQVVEPSVPQHILSKSGISPHTLIFNSAKLASSHRLDVETGAHSSPASPL